MIVEIFFHLIWVSIILIQQVHLTIQIFLNLAYCYETKFFKHMEKLQIEFPNVITCVSRHVPKIIEFITALIANGYAYESNSSVLFLTH